MLIRVATLERIRAGDVTVQFRRWTRPRVKPGTIMHTAVGQVAVEAVSPCAQADLSEADARAAGAADLSSLRADLSGRSGDLYRIELRWVGEDPRITLRETPPTPEELADLLARLDRWDSGKRGPWTHAFLVAIRARPETRAAELAEDVGWERDPFKTHVRKLKNLGLTESLEIGYRLSARGRAVLEALETR